VSYGALAVIESEKLNGSQQIAFKPASEEARQYHATCEARDCLVTR
jgi:hypothetical protein